jgi:SOS-response transcriptional repressor LexA
MTPRQRQVLDAIEEFRDRYGLSPSIREIGSAIGLSSSSTTHSHVQSLINDGLLEEMLPPGHPGAANRNLRLTAAGQKARGNMKAETEPL